jgi:hypothetical protein
MLRHIHQRPNQWDLNLQNSELNKPLYNVLKHKVFLYSPGWLELMITLHYPPEGWDYTCVPPYLLYMCFFLL